MKQINNLDKAKFGQREFNMKHMFILHPAFALFSLPLPSHFCACNAEANLAELVGHDAQQKMENKKTCSKLNSLYLLLFERRWTDLFLSVLRALKRFLMTLSIPNKRCTPRVILISTKYSKNANAVLKSSLRLVRLIFREKNRAVMECCKRTYIKVMHSSYVVLLSCRSNSDELL